MPATKLTIPELLEQYPTIVMAMSPQQRSFTLEYIAGFFAQGKYDAKAAVRTAYPNIASPERPDAERHVAIWANRILRNKKIAYVLGLHSGLTESEMLFADLQRLVKKGLRKNKQKAQIVTPDVARALLVFEAYVQKANS